MKIDTTDAILIMKENGNISIALPKQISENYVSENSLIIQSIALKLKEDKFRKELFDFIEEKYKCKLKISEINWS